MPQPNFLDISIVLMYHLMRMYAIIPRKQESVISLQYPRKMVFPSCEMDSPFALAFMHRRKHFPQGIVRHAVPLAQD